MNIRDYSHAYFISLFWCQKHADFLTLFECAGRQTGSSASRYVFYLLFSLFCCSFPGSLSLRSTVTCMVDYICTLRHEYASLVTHKSKNVMSQIFRSSCTPPSEATYTLFKLKHSISSSHANINSCGCGEKQPLKPYACLLWTAKVCWK